MLCPLSFSFIPVVSFPLPTIASIRTRLFVSVSIPPHGHCVDQIYDRDHSGTISKSEMIKVLTSLHVKANSGGAGDADDGHQYSSLGDSARTKAFVRKLFNKVDKDHSGRLTYMEFLQASLKYPALVEMVLPASTP